MPLSSAEISAMSGGYTSMYAGQQSFASMIGQGFGPNQNAVLGESVMGRIANRTEAVGAPFMRGAMGMLGLDPMTLGLRGALGAWQGGAGILGAGVAGLGTAAAAGGVAAGVGYVGNQVYSGMAQQQALNQTLRQNFAFQRPGGGQGFDSSQMSQIGATMREMTHQFGPGGEVTGFRELTQMAGKMGQMGMLQGVRDVQEFGRRFKDMIGHLKTIAKDLGTSLEGAIEFANAAKGSGIFGTQGVKRFAAEARGTAAAGGLALSEVTSAASIGSQIARSVGGLGRQGANAGMRTIGQIGTAQQMGILSEEDIYNVTGQTGAEGRQAFMASQMEKTANFLRGGKGRRLLASIAGKDGSLNEDAVMQLMSGGMGIQETMQRDQENLSKIGRANFIRNEGRLRGAAMERFGAFLPGMQLQQWAQSKGIDINEMSDRNMLFAQRQLGMGRDEMDAAIKMVNNMPRIMQEMKTRGQDERYMSQVTEQQNLRGIEGVKRRLEQAREKIQGRMQEVGQHIMSAGSEMVEGFFNKLTDRYETLASKKVDDAARELLGTGNRADFERNFGAVTDKRFTGAAASLGLESKAALRGPEGPGLLDKIGLTLDRGGAPKVPEFTGTFRTAGERQEAYADALRGKGSTRANFWGAVGTGALAGGLVGGAAGAAFGGIGAVPGAIVGGLVGAGAAAFGGMFGADKGERQLGAFFESEETQGLVLGIHDADRKVRDQTMARVTKEMGDLVAREKKGEHLGKEDSARLEGLKAIGAFGEFMELERAHPGGIPADALKALEKKHGMSVDDIKAKGQAQRAITAHGMSERAEATYRKFGAQGTEERERLAAGGVYDAKTGKLSAKFAEAIEKTGIKGGGDVLEDLLGSVNLRAGLEGTAASHEADRTKITSAAGLEESARKRLSQMSVAEQRKLASAAAQAGAGDFAQMIYGQAGAQQRVEGVVKRRGKTRAAGELLGLESEDVAALGKEKDEGKRTQILASAMGVKTGDPGNKEFLDNLQNYNAALSRGDAGAATLNLQKVQGSSQFKKFEDEKREKTAAQRRNEDPVQANIEKNTTQMSKYLELLVKGNDKSNALLEKAARDEKNAEGT